MSASISATEMQLTYDLLPLLADKLADFIDEHSPAWITFMTHPQAAVVSVLQKP